MLKILVRLLGIAATLCLLDTPALAATDVQNLDGKLLGIFWILPFVGMLLSIAVLPLTVPRFWHQHYGEVSAMWALAFLLPAAAFFGPQLAAHELLHTATLEYMPFLILIGSLFCVTGHIHIKGNLHGSPALNTCFLGVGTALASIMGTPTIRICDPYRCAKKCTIIH